MAEILVVADEPWVVNDVRAALADRRYSITEEHDPRSVAARVEVSAFDAVVVDMQVGSMGGMAVTRAVRNSTGPDGSTPPVIVLLDRDADGFLARRAGATTWVRKPFGAHELRRAITESTALGAS
jgi:DNA-binding response OmpR family regulator